MSEARRVLPVARRPESAGGKWLWSLKCSGEIHGGCIQTEICLLLAKDRFEGEDKAPTSHFSGKLNKGHRDSEASLFPRERSDVYGAYRDDQTLHLRHHFGLVLHLFKKKNPNIIS